MASAIEKGCSSWVFICLVSIHLMVSIRLVVSIRPQCSIVGVYLPNGCLLALWGIFASWGYLPYGVSICSSSRYPALHLNTNRNLISCSVRRYQALNLNTYRNLISCSLRRYQALNLNTNSGYLFSSWVFI